MRTLRRFFVLTTALLLTVSTVFARAETPAFSEAELDQMLAPIALYPDSLLTQMLMAATYPLEVVEAARWSRANPDLRGQDAVRAAEDRTWDPSVKSLVAFPDVLAKMDEDLDWTERLGDAFLAQPDQVMETVQHLRQKAEDAGNLESGEHYRVEHQGPTIVVESPYPDVVYVPYYDPFVVYGTWWWPHHHPVYWSPWVGYQPVYAGYSGFYWGGGITIGYNFFYSDYDWDHHHVYVVDNTPWYYHEQRPDDGYWRHDPYHRRGVPYSQVNVYNTYVQHDRNVRLRERDRNDDAIDRRYRRDAAGNRAVPQTNVRSVSADRTHDGRTQNVPREQTENRRNSTAGQATSTTTTREPSHARDSREPAAETRRNVPGSQTATQHRTEETRNVGAKPEERSSSRRATSTVPTRQSTDQQRSHAEESSRPQHVETPRTTTPSSSRSSPRQSGTSTSNSEHQRAVNGGDRPEQSRQNTPSYSRPTPVERSHEPAYGGSESRSSGTYSAPAPAPVERGRESNSGGGESRDTSTTRESRPSSNERDDRDDRGSGHRTKASWRSWFN